MSELQAHHCIILWL